MYENKQQSKLDRQKSAGYSQLKQGTYLIWLNYKGENINVRFKMR